MMHITVGLSPTVRMLILNEELLFALDRARAPARDRKIKNE